MKTKQNDKRHLPICSAGIDPDVYDDATSRHHKGIIGNTDRTKEEKPIVGRDVFGDRDDFVHESDSGEVPY